MPNLKIDSNQPEIQGSLPISEIVKGQIAQHGIKGIWLLIGAVLAFLITQFWGLSTVVYEISGKQKYLDETIQILFEERNDTFSTLIELQQQLATENKDLRNQINNKFQ